MVAPFNPLSARYVITRLESAGERGQDKLLPSSASRFVMCLAAELYRPAVELAIEALNSFPANFLRRTGAFLGRLELARVGPFWSALNLLGRVGFDLDLAGLVPSMTFPFLTNKVLILGVDLCT